MVKNNNKYILLPAVFIEGNWRAMSQQKKAVLSFKNCQHAQPPIMGLEMGGQNKIHALFRHPCLRSKRAHTNHYKGSCVYIHT